MKKILAVVVLVMLMVSGMANAEMYPQVMLIVEADREEDIIILEDFNGNQWVWEGVEDWMVGDVVAVLMDDNNTKDITDDVMMELKYCGWLEGWTDKECVE